MTEAEELELLAIAAAAARAKRQKPGSDRPIMQGVGAVNRGVANLIDGMAGPVNRGVNAIAGTNLSQTPTADMMAATGVRRLDREPDGLVEQALVGVGEGLGALVPFAGAMRALSGGTQATTRLVQTPAVQRALNALRGRGGPTVPANQAVRLQSAAPGASPTMAGVAETIRQPFVAAPAAAIGAEAAAGAGARVAGEVASRQTDNALARPVAEVAGGVLGGVSAYGLARAAGTVGTIPLVAQAGRGLMAAAAPFSRGGARKIAEDSVRALSADPDAAADMLMRGENLGNLTPAQQTGEAGIMSLERGFMERSQAMRDRVTKGVTASRDALRGAAFGDAQGFSPTDTRVFFQERMDRHAKTMDSFVRAAESRAEKALERVEPRRRSAANAEMVRRELDIAFDQARRQEQSLWNRIDRTVEIPTAQARAALQSALEETGPVSADSIPGKAMRFLGEGSDAFGETTTMRDLHRLYSEMRKAGREALARAAPDEFTYRQATNIAEAILRDIEAAPAAGDAARRLADARAFSRSMSERFDQGSVARTTAVDRAGGERVPAELTLDRSVGQGGNAGAVAVDDIRRATGTTAADPAMTDFMRERFVDQTVRDGAVDASRAETFIRANRELIDRFPDSFQLEMINAITAARQADRFAARAAEAVKALGNTKAGGQVGFANAAKGREVAKSIFEADNPATAARAIARAAAKDQTGDAVLGLQAGVVDEVIRRAAKGDRIDGATLARLVNSDPDIQKVVRAVLPPDAQIRLKAVAAQLRKLDTFDAVGPTDIESAPNMMIATFMQIQAAKTGRALGTGTIQVPGMFVGRMRQIMGRLSVDHADALIREAVTENPRLLAALLTGPGSSRAQIRQAEQRLTAWAIGTLAASGQDEPQE